MALLSHRLQRNVRPVPWRRWIDTKAAGLSTATSRPLVEWRVDDDTPTVGTITLQAAATYNALTVDMGQDLSALCRELQYDLTTTTTTSHSSKNICAIVLTSQGDDAFSAGGDFDWLKQLRQNAVHENADRMLNFYHSFLGIRTLPVPVIAAIQGPAIGAGAGLALACDLKVAAAKKTILGFTFSKLGIHAGMGCSHLLTQALGGPSALVNEILLTGKILSGQECLDLKLINSVSNNPKKAATERALTIARQHPVAVRTMLQTLRSQQDLGLEAALQREAMAQAMCYARSDWGEGVDAVAEKREPSFDSYHNK